MTITKEQLEERRYGLGASDISVLMGLNKWRSSYDLWLEKTGQKEPGDLSGNDSIYWGNALEDVAAKRYERETGRTVYEPQETFRHPDYPFLMAHVDRLVVGEDRGVEIKTSVSDSGWGQEGTDDIPLPYRVQVETCAMLTGISIWDVPLLVAGNRAILEYKLYTVIASPEIQSEILSRAIEFWDCVQGGFPPEGITLDDAKQRYRRSEPKEIYASDEVYEAWQRLVEAKSAKKQAAEDEEVATGRICNFMGDADTLVRDGRVIATWRNGSVLDHESLRADHGDIYSAYTVPKFDTTQFTKDNKALASRYRIDGRGVRVLHVKGVLS